MGGEVLSFFYLSADKDLLAHGCCSRRRRAVNFFAGKGAAMSNAAFPSLRLRARAT